MTLIKFLCLVLTFFFIGIFHASIYCSTKYYSTFCLDDFIDGYVTQVSGTSKLNHVCNTCAQMLGGGTLQSTRV